MRKFNRISIDAVSLKIAYHYSLEMKNLDWEINSRDLENGLKVYLEEKVNHLDEHSLFSSFIYSILSAAENYKKLKKLEAQLKEIGITPPKNVGEIEIVAGKLESVVKKSRFPNRKIRRIRKFLRWWCNSNLPFEILKDSKTKRERGEELRELLVKECPGIGYKTASLLLVKLGYLNLVPIDVWSMRFLKANGHSVKLPDYKKVSGPKGKEYLRLEEILRENASKYSVPPAIFQFALWSKYSSWRETKGSKKV